MTMFQSYVGLLGLGLMLAAPGVALAKVPASKLCVKDAPAPSDLPPDASTEYFHKLKKGHYGGERALESVKLAVIHNGGMMKNPVSQTIQNHLIGTWNAKGKVSSHFFVSNEGKIYYLVNIACTAHNAAGKTDGKQLINNLSIGIDLPEPPCEYADGKKTVDCPKLGAYTKKCLEKCTKKCPTECKAACKDMKPSHPKCVRATKECTEKCQQGCAEKGAECLGQYPAECRNQYPEKLLAGVNALLKWIGSRTGVKLNDSQVFGHREIETNRGDPACNFPWEKIGLKSGEHKLRGKRVVKLP